MVEVKKRFYIYLTALVAVMSGILLLNVFGATSQAALPRDCTGNSIINCGAVTAGELAQKYNQNATGDLPAVYNAYGISGSMIANTGSVAKMGEVHKDGRVTVNGETVATSAMSIGRHNLNGSTPKVIGSKTYYNSPPSTSFNSPSIVAFVYFTADGQFQSAIITSCGNPVSAVPVPPKPPVPTPTYKCVSLTAAKISRNEYNFKAVAEVTGGATVTSYRYDFGDGSSQTSPNATISHTYTTPGTYTAKLSVDVKVGSETKTVTAPTCQVPVTVEVQPAYKCDALTIRTINLENRTYAFDLTHTVSGGASLKSVDYTFGDGQSRENVSPEEAKTVTHTYASPGTYTTTATLHFMTGNNQDTVQDDKCQVVVTTTQAPPPPPPPAPTPPVAELPKTGPVDLIGGGLGISSLIAAGYYWFASRRGLLAALLEL